MWDEGIGPYARGEQKDQMLAWENAKQPLREFMIAQIEASGNVPTVLMVLEHRGVDASDPSEMTWEDDVDMLTLVPSFVISELKTAFLIGFRIYLPFLVIDMVIASLLVSMGMMMLPPVLVSLPFKLLLFVLVDGWTLIVGSLLSGVMIPVGGA
jgi:flagellar biosynthetic protein FliP